MSAFTRVAVLCGRELRSHGRERRAMALMVVSSLVVGAGARGCGQLDLGFGPADDVPPDDTAAARLEPPDDGACRPGPFGQTAVVGEQPPWLGWPSEPADPSDAQLLMRVDGRGPLEIEVLPLATWTSEQDAVRCVEADLAAERDRRLWGMGIAARSADVVELEYEVLPVERGLRLRTDPRRTSAMALLGVLLMMVMSLTIDLAPDARTHGFLETLFGLAVRRREIVIAWWLVGTLAGLAGGGLFLIGYGIAAALLGGGWLLPGAAIACAPLACALLSAVLLVPFLDTPDLRAAMLRSVPAITLVLGATGLAAAVDAHAPPLGALVPLGGLWSVFGGEVSPGYAALASLVSLPTIAATLFVAVRIVERMDLGTGATGRRAARRAAGNYGPEAALLFLIAVLGVTVGMSFAPGGSVTVASLAGGQLVFLALPALATGAVLGLPTRRLLSLHAPRRWVWPAVPLVTAGTLALSLLLFRLLPADGGWIAVFEQAFAPFTSPLGVVAVAVIPAVCEELLFRGAMLGLLRRGLPTWLALLLQASAFALLHGAVFRLAPTFAIGVALGLVVLRTRALWPAMAIHALHNLGAATVVGDGVSRLPEGPAGWITLAVVAAIGVGAIGLLPRRASVGGARPSSGVSSIQAVQGGEPPRR